jgi:hypothetical protein
LIEISTRTYKQKRGLEEETNQRTIIREATEKWQERWQASPKGRTTYQYFSRVKDRLGKRWIRPDYYMK